MGTPPRFRFHGGILTAVILVGVGYGWTIYDVRSKSITMFAISVFLALLYIAVAPPLFYYYLKYTGQPNPPPGEEIKYRRLPAALAAFFTLNVVALLGLQLLIICLEELRHRRSEESWNRMLERMRANDPDMALRMSQYPPKRNDRPDGSIVTLLPAAAIYSVATAVMVCRLTRTPERPELEGAAELDKMEEGARAD